MKKSILIVFCLMLVLSLMTTSMAIAKPNSVKSQKSEYDMVKELKMKSDEELKAAGLSSKQIKEIRELDYVKELKKRAQLSDKELKGMGYNNEQISVLKTFTGTEAEIYSLSPTLYWNQRLDYYQYYVQTTYTLYYKWWWTSKPIIDLTDIIGYGWGENFLLDFDASYHKVSYKDQYGNHRGAYFYEIRSETPQASASSKFPVHKDINSFPCWAYQGEGEFQLYHPNRISTFQLVIKYGHTVLTVTPSLSGSGPSISFSTGVEEQENYINRTDTIQN